MKRSPVKLLIPAVLLLLAAAVAAKDKLKPWTQWTVEDAKKILNDSPWGQTQAFQDPNARLEEDVNISSDYFAYFRIRFISAKPIRQAFLRILELSLSKATLQQLEDARGFVGRKFDQTIVVAVALDTTNPRFFGPVLPVLNSSITATLKNSTFLELDNGKRAFLQEYQPPGPDGLGALFIFPRMVDNAPFITPKAGSVRFFSRFPTRNWSAKNPLILNMKLKIADFEYDGAIEY